MLGQDDELRLWMSAHGQGHLARKGKAGAAIGNPDQLVAKALSCQMLAIGGTGKIVCRIGMRVIYIWKGQKSMQECLDGGTWATRFVKTMSQIVDHLGVAHAFAFE